MNSQEIWKDIPGYEGFYQVSNFGNVRSVKRLIKRRDGRFYMCNGKTIAQRPSTTCHYLITDLCRNNIRKHVLTHILVARTFLENFDKSLEVNHKDGNVLNNKLSNLELVTHQRNIDHSIITGLKNDYGENSSNSALTNAQANEIRARWQNGEKQNALALEYGVSKQTVNNIVHFKTYFK